MQVIPTGTKSQTTPAVAENDASTTDPLKAAYLLPLLARHKNNETITYEDLIKSFEDAKSITTSGSAKGDSSLLSLKKLNHLHQSQLIAYESSAKQYFNSYLAKYTPPPVMTNCDESSYIDNCVKEATDYMMGWKVGSTVLDEMMAKMKDKARTTFNETNISSKTTTTTATLTTVVEEEPEDNNDDDQDNDEDEAEEDDDDDDDDDAEDEDEDDNDDDAPPDGPDEAGTDANIAKVQQQQQQTTRNTRKRRVIKNVKATGGRKSQKTRGGGAAGSATGVVKVKKSTNRRNTGGRGRGRRGRGKNN